MIVVASLEIMTAATKGYLLLQLICSGLVLSFHLDSSDYFLQSTAIVEQRDGQEEEGKTVDA